MPCGFQTNRKRKKSPGWFEGIEGRKRSGKGGRNKSSASNRGRVLVRFYSQTLNSIAIGFLASSLPKREIFLFYSVIFSSTVSFLFREVCFHFFLGGWYTPTRWLDSWFFVHENLIASNDVIKHLKRTNKIIPSKKFDTESIDPIDRIIVMS